MGVATTVEYVLLAGVSIVVFLALLAALSAFSASSREDAAAIAARRTAVIVSSAVCEAIGAGESSASIVIDLPGLICGMPYVVYPSPEGRSIIVDVGSGPSSLRCRVPLPLRAVGVRFAGFMASPSPGHAIGYDAASRTVTLA